MTRKLVPPRSVPPPILQDAPDAQRLSPLLALNVPQVLPSGYPHNLPPLRDRPRFNPFTGLDPSAPVPGPGVPPGLEIFGIFDPHHYAELIEGVVAVGVISQLIIPLPGNRRNLLAIRNSSPGTENIFVGFGSPASTASWLRLETNQIVLFDAVVPQNDVWVICDAATGQVSYAHSTIA